MAIRCIRRRVYRRGKWIVIKKCILIKKVFIGRPGPPGPQGPQGPQGPPGECLCPCGNLLLNPGFEDFTADVPANWMTDEPTVIVEPANDGDIHTGQSSAVFQFTMSIDEANLWQDVAGQEGCCYDFEFWAKGATGGGQSGGVVATVEFRDQLGDLITSEQIEIMGGSLDSNSWTSYRLVTQPAPSGTEQIRVNFFVEGNGKSLRLDDVILTSYGCNLPANSY